MDSRSSTSSSEARADSRARWRGRPFAGLLAIGLIVAVDLFVGSSRFPWAALVPLVEPEQSVYWGVARDRAELSRVSSQGDATKVAVLGSSRGHTGFLYEQAEQALPGVVFAQLSHALQDATTIYALVPDLIDAGIDVVVLTLSQADTHRPVRLEPLPAKSNARLASLAPLVDALGLDVLLERRRVVYRIAAAQLSNLYRYRESLGRAGANWLREFRLDARLQGERPVQLLGEAVLGRTGPTRLAPRRESLLLARVLPQQRAWPRQLGWYWEVRDGPQVPVQFDYVARTIDELTAAGVQVVIAECPIHPIGTRVQRDGTVEAFRAFASQQAEREGVQFVPLDDAAPYRMIEFGDLFHLNELGALRYTRSILASLARDVLPAD